MRAILCALLLLDGDDFAAGIRAYREGRFAEAVAAFAAAELAAGADAPPELLHDRALAALRVGDWTQAEAASRRAAERGGVEFATLHAFVRGNVAFARAQVAAEQATAVEAEPFAFEAAIALARTAAASWQEAALLRAADWPQARRNVERALVLLADLQRKKAEAEEKRKRTEPDKAQPKLVPPPPQEPPEAEQPPAVRELDPEEVRRLLDRLAAKEKEKQMLRRRVAAPAAGVAGTEDW